MLDHGQDWVYAAAFHPRGTVLATAGEAGPIHVWLAPDADRGARAW